MKFVWKALRVCTVRGQWKSSVSLWEVISVLVFVFQLFTDGTTNKLVGCYVEDSPDDVVLVRVYGNKTELIVDRDNELKSFQVVLKQMFSLSCALYEYSLISQ